MEFIKYLDIFNIKFNFYANNQPNNRSLFGGIMTSIYLTICILIFIILSIDDLKRLNPITTMSEISYAERKLVNMEKEKIWIPFRMVDYENNFIDHREILYIKPYLIEGRYNETIGMDLKYTLLNYKLCNETSMAKRPSNHIINVPLNQLFCIEKDDMLFGGNWNNDFLNYIEINLYLCEDDIAYNSSDPRCSKIVNYLKDLNSSLIFDFHFPVVQFQPTNFHTPIEIIYKNYYYRLSTYNYKIEKLFIKENILSDDINMLTNNYKNSSCWGMSILYSDDYYLSNKYDAISDNSNTSRIYALNIYMDDGLVYYTRTYKKIFLIISNVFPIFRIILYFFKTFTQNIKKSLAKKDLIELIFEKSELKPIKIFKKFDDLNKNHKQDKVPNKSEIVLIKDKNIKNNDYNFYLKGINNYKKNIQNNNEFNERKDNNNNKIITSLDNKSDKNEKSIFDNLKFDESPRKDKKAKKYYNKKKSIFPQYYYFLDIIFDNLINPKKFFCISKTYFVIYNYMCKIYDISTYIVLFKNFNIVKNILKEYMCENYELFTSTIVKKINISDLKLIEGMKNDIKDKKSILYNNYFC